ncbi:MAG: amidohydrolase family protein [Tepidisphaeraceae bacterium]
MHILQGKVLEPVSASQCRLIDNASVVIGDDGRIQEVLSGRKPNGKTIGDEGCWILPGFIDAHLHMPQWDRRGIDGLPLGQWQQTVGYPAEARLRDPRVARDLAEQFVSGMIANGTTTIAAFGSPFSQEVDGTFDVLAKRGLRAIYGMTLSDIGMPAELTHSADAALDDSRALCAKWHGAENGRLLYALSPRASIRCSERLMRGAAALADMLHCYLQTHVAESLEELSEVRQMYSPAVDEIEVFDDAGLLTPRTLLAHGVFLDHQERRQVAKKGCAIIHCPTANFFRASGLMDYVAHRADGIRIALGSSIAGGPDPFMPRVAVQGLNTAKAIKVHTLPRLAYQVPTPAEAWYTLTKRAAEALGLSDRIGSIAAGYEADCLVVRPEPWIAGLSEDQQVSALLYTLTPAQIEHVFVAGRELHV